MSLQARQSCCVYPVSTNDGIYYIIGNSEIKRYRIFCTVIVTFVNRSLNLLLLPLFRQFRHCSAALAVGTYREWVCFGSSMKRGDFHLKFTTSKYQQIV